MRKCLLMAALLIAPATASAAVIEVGDTVGYAFLQPTIASSVFNPGPLVVSGGVEVPSFEGSILDPIASVDISEDLISLSFLRDFTLPAVSFSGFVVFDTALTLDAFTGAFVSVGSTVAPTSLTFDADNIFVNLAGLSAVAGDTINISVAGSPDTPVIPEPTTLTAAFVGVSAVLGGALRRRRDA